MNALVRGWYQGSGWLRLLRPLEWLFRYLARRRRQGFLAHPERVWLPPVPLIVVGNITVGGTGKTPLVLFLVDWARRRGFRPGVISRGYGARPPQYPFVVRPDSSAGEVGDEPLLIAARSDCPVVIDPDRPAAARHLLEHFDCDLIISDDGLQHYALGRHLEILVLDSERGLGNGRCLPEGPLREGVSRLDEVDLVVVNGQGDFCPPGAHRMELAPARLIAIDGSRRCAPADWPGGRRVHAIAGIGNPQRFFDTLRGLGFDPVPHSFADHHAYRSQDLRFDEALPILMTEKDAVKCRGLAPPDSWYLTVEARLAPVFESALASKLNSHISAN